VRKGLTDVAERLSTFVQAAFGSDRPRLSVVTDGANGLQAIADRLAFSSTPVLDRDPCMQSSNRVGLATSARNAVCGLHLHKLILDFTAGNE
jgi:hypothetical protein